ncbi:hypothetical protein G7007_12690 [Pseudomonas entomophila]|uniref:hypothetical protein n=1 Tax=Pseudomonas entomophila TaxID=312306 RepID=UPI0015E484A0|nr:hypothetical protein [Pseudomonas entomophila]MBA1193710.1 hypothetical protein [Pseudomonas entomophila]
MWPLKAFKISNHWPMLAFLFLNNTCYAFEIYTYLPYSTSSFVEHHGNALDKIYSAHNIKKIKLVYDENLLALPADPANRKYALAAPQKIHSVASKDAYQNDSLVSLDIESWNRFDTETPTKILNILKTYRNSSPNTTLGLYATVPQNTYKWDSSKIEFYEKMNRQYIDVAQEVDYFSPSLYNYSGRDFSSWLEGAKYNIAAAKKYSLTKKVLPYITPEVSNNGITSWLSYDEMLMRLKALESLGADGCIIWGSSQSRDTSGARPSLNPYSGWFKAILDFSTMQNR